VIELGGTVVSLSDSKGAIVATGDKGLSPASINEIAALKLKFGSLSTVKVDGFKYVEGARPWTHFKKLDVALPCATQNEVSKEEAEALVAAGVTIVAEGSNMGSTQDAITVFEAARVKGMDGDKQPLWYAPGKAANVSFLDSFPLLIVEKFRKADFCPLFPVIVWWCRCVRSRDGPELSASPVDRV
jgi:glutamate dehydrogenase (NADP+)